MGQGLTAGCQLFTRSSTDLQGVQGFQVQNWTTNYAKSVFVEAQARMYST